MNKILLIEDDPLTQRLVQKHLESLSQFVSFDFLSSVTLTEGIEIFDREHPDLVLVDLSLPDSSPKKTIQHLGHFNQKCLIVLTSASMPEYIIDATRQGARDYILKSTMQDTKEFAKKILRAWSSHEAFMETEQIPHVRPPKGQPSLHSLREIGRGIEGFAAREMSQGEFDMIMHEIKALRAVIWEGIPGRPSITETLATITSQMKNISERMHDTTVEFQEFIRSQNLIAKQNISSRYTFWGVAATAIVALFGSVLAFFKR